MGGTPAAEFLYYYVLCVSKSKLFISIWNTSLSVQSKPETHCFLLEQPYQCCWSVKREQKNVFYVRAQRLTNLLNILAFKLLLLQLNCKLLAPVSVFFGADCQTSSLHIITSVQRRFRWSVSNSLITFSRKHFFLGSFLVHHLTWQLAFANAFGLISPTLGPLRQRGGRGEDFYRFDRLEAWGRAPEGRSK